MGLCLAVGLLGWLLAGLLPFAGGSVPYAARATALCTGFVACAWLSGALPIGAASLVPLAALPLLGVSTMEATAAAYGDPILWMFFGGFVLALGIEHTGLHRRLALAVLRQVGVAPARIVLGLMLVTAGLSMWINNSAAALLVLPIALALIGTLEQSAALDADSQRNFAFTALLGLAYAASIGGLGTPVGTPPNALFFSNYKPFVDAGAPPLTFAQWLLFGVPLVATLLPLTWLVLVKTAPMRGALPQARTLLAEEARRLGPLRPGERRMAWLFALAAFAWSFRRDIVLGQALTIPGWWRLLPLEAPERIGDGTVAALVAVLAFSVPSGEAEGEPLLPWRAVQKVPWDILFLIGGGIALAQAFASTGLARALGEALRPLLQGLPTLMVVLVLSLAITFLSEITSNTAVAALFLPIVVGMAAALEVDPRLLMLPCTLAASNGYMLPVATPPNAVVCATGQVPLGRMAKVGFSINVLSAVLVAAAVYLIGIPLLGIDASRLPEWASRVRAR